MRHPARQRRLLASLAAVGQQTAIVVVAIEGQADRYVVIDGYKRIAALQQLGRDIVEAVVWPMSEADVPVKVFQRAKGWESRIWQRLAFSPEALADDGDEHVDRHGDPDLGRHGVQIRVDHEIDSLPTRDVLRSFGADDGAAFPRTFDGDAVAKSPEIAYPNCSDLGTNWFRGGRRGPRPEALSR